MNLFNLFKKKITVVVHDGDFHPDEVFACAVFFLWAEKTGNKIKIIRNREKEIITKADIVADVGGVYDPDRNRFDHHQKEGAGIHENGIPYASFGLVWKKYGAEVCSDREVANSIERDLVVPVDARDNGINISATNDFKIDDHRTHDAIDHFNFTYQEDQGPSYKQFEKALYLTKEILIREIAWAKALIDGEKETLELIRKQDNPEILILEKNIEWHQAVSNNKNIKFIVYSGKSKQDWRIQVGRNDLKDYNSNRAKLPESWWGLRDKDLINTSGVKEAVFCTNRGWLAVAKTKEGAIEMANKALRNLDN